jgi:hypothetical protein
MIVGTVWSVLVLLDQMVAYVWLPINTFAAPPSSQIGSARGGRMADIDLPISDVVRPHGDGGIYRVGH